MRWRDIQSDWYNQYKCEELKKGRFSLGNLQILKHGLTHWVSDEHLALSVDSTAPKTTKTLSKRVKNTLRSAQKHFLKTICGPNSSYSSALIQALPRSGMRASAAPPLHTEKSRSSGLMTRTHALRSAGTMCRISCCRRSGRPGSSVFPPAQAHSHMLEQLCSDWTVQPWHVQHIPDRRMFPTKLRRRSMSDRRTDLKTLSCIP